MGDLKTVSVPAPMAELFSAAEAVVSKYFRERKDHPEHGTIEISGERYILVRAASLSVEFFGLVRELYGADRAAEADEFARNILFDLAHAIGRKDAKRFHEKMGLEDPIAKLSAGPIHFAHAGWAFVTIFPESRPTPDEEFFLLYEHPYSFESDAWLRAGERLEFPVCIMNSGYSSGWCEESFGVDLVAAEVRCRARGDDVCRFVMAAPARVEAHVKRELPSGSAIIPDFFARKRAEERLRLAHAELELRVEARTADLKREMEERRRVERELHQQHKLEALGRLAAGIAHDFNNLMAVVLTNGALLERSFSADDARRVYTEEISSAVQRAADLTRQLLAFGRGRPTETDTIEVDRAVTELGRMLTRLLGDDVTLELSLGAGGAHVRAARSEIEQIVVNLVVNARDALPHGGRIEISTSLGARPGGKEVVTLRVSDSGQGIAEDAQRSIFDPFFTTKEGVGTGLGLSTVYGIVQRSGGSISVESAPGRGTTFEVTLATVAPRRPSSAPPPEVGEVRGSGEQILVVEDQQNLREIVRRSLVALGYSGVVAADPAEAIELIRGGLTPRVLLTDVMLPQMDGAALASRIETLVPGIAVLFMSGHASDVLDQRRSQGGSVAFLPKPFTLSALADALARALRGEGGGGGR